MALYPQAKQLLLPENAVQRKITPTQVIVHTAVDSKTASSLYPYFSRGDVGAESHFFVKWNGVVEQYVDTSVMANANRFADVRAISIETEDDGDPEGNPWSPEQMIALTLLIDWCCSTHHIPRHQCPQWDWPGLGWHSMWGFKDPVNLTGTLPDSPWTMFKGKTCPGRARIRQFLDIVLPSLEALEDVDVPEDDEDIMDLWLYINACYHEAGRAHDEDGKGRRYWYRDFLSNTGEERVKRMQLMEQLLELP